MEASSTYVRRTDNGYEFGRVVRARNWRKANDSYLPHGVARTVIEAERKRVELAEQPRECGR